MVGAEAYALSNPYARRGPDHHALPANDLQPRTGTDVVTWLCLLKSPSTLADPCGRGRVGVTPHPTPARFARRPSPTTGRGTRMMNLAV